MKVPFNMALSTMLEFVCKTKLILSKLNEKRSSPYFGYKPKQVDCLKASLQGDCIGLLPTGYGKSLIFESLPYMMQGTTAPSTVIIISPLNAIIEEQLRKLTDDAVQITATFDESRIHACQHTYVLSHPEDILKPNIFRVMRNEMWQTKVSHIVIDEAHCVVQWGADFRPKFRDLKDLRALFNKAHVLALTATASKRTQEEITAQLLLHRTTIVSASIDRPNIMFSIRKRLPNTKIQDSYDSIVNPLIKELRDLGSSFPRTIVYCSLKWCGYIHEAALTPQYDGKDDIVPSLVAQFHASCTNQMKKEVVDSMSCEDGLRLLLATEAYGMGADPVAVRRVIHIGVPRTIETYVQEVGRGGRDGEPTEAILHYNPSDIASNVQGMSAEMRNYCTTDGCRRVFLAKAFGQDIFTENRIHHECCDNCKTSCVCKDCSPPVSPSCQVTSDFDFDGCHQQFGVDSEMKSLPNENEHHDIHKVKILYGVLCQYFDAENSLSSNPSPSVVTGLTPALAEKISLNYIKYSNRNNLLSDFTYLNISYVENIFKLISKVAT
ncbi:probable ATP-dependent DNA helicase RecS [Ptychodera flava]|uniref:probable ATP-dependent DNA helicase RecS n=1 Tax=Ptychodera flava TaxID=63121 RepID=UPI00396A1CA0